MEKVVQIAATNALSFALSYVALMALMSIVLAIQVIRGRYAAKVALGDGENRMLARRIRAHGNFSEYAPFLGLLLIGLALVGAGEWLVHAVGLIGLTGRVLHAAGLSRTSGPSWPRQAGMLLTFSALALGAVSILILAWK
ncbi:MAG TPA: MAPEG family protein [Rhabdaerophilum sp.]|nr:MAPEG family protein [Rhabdaerophilum sp.]